MKHVKTLALAAIIGWAAGQAGSMAAPPVRAPQFKPSDFRAVDPQNTLVIDTTKGRVIVEMFPDIAPLTVARIKELARAKFYDGLTFHRVINDFMAQGGDPKGDGTGGSDKPDVPGEFAIRRAADTPFVTVSADAGLEDGFVTAMPMRSQNSGLMVMTADNKVSAWGVWCPGVAGMARGGGSDSANSQFFLMSAYNAGLERKYTPWGRVLVGLDVVRTIKLGEPPVNPDKMTSVRVLADLPAADRPKLSVLDTGGAAFKALIAYDHTLHGGSFSICDVELPVNTQ